MKVTFTDGFWESCERLGLTRPRGWAPRKIYWRLVPYPWRPGPLWYRLKCFFWYRHRTVKPRTLPGHGWVDRDELLLHCCFEILARFMETEFVDREGRSAEEGHYARDLLALKELHRWWREDYPDLCEAGDRAALRETQKRLHQLINLRGRLWT